MAKGANPAMVVITGGEPLMHNLDPLTKELKNQGLRVHLETSGAHPFTGVFDWVTFSPKTYKMPDPSIYARVNELKIVVAHPEDLDWASMQESKLSEGVIKYLQPEWNTVESKELVFNYVLRHPQWRSPMASQSPNP